MLPDCPKPRNEDKIQAAHKAFRDAKKSSASDKSNKAHVMRGKFRPPDDSEKNKRVIDNVHMFYQARHKRWVPDKSKKNSESAEKTDKSDGEAKQETKEELHARLTRATATLAEAVEGL